MLRYFRQLSVALDLPVTVLRRLPFGGGTSIRLGDAATSVEMGDIATRSIWVTRGGDQPVSVEITA